MTGPPRRRKRRVAPEDDALWREVVREATPLDPDRRRKAEAPSAPEVPAPSPTAAPAAPPVPQPDTPRPRRLLRPTGPEGGPKTGADLVERDIAPIGRPTPGLDRRTAERLRRGTREPDARIDLHGMTAERAHRALDRRIGEALARGERLVLVITGKGGKRRDPADAPFMRNDQGVLRQQAPLWLRSGPHAGRIVGIFQAPPRHGGAGAFYVYLKKPR